MSCSWMDRVGATRELWVVINYGSESAPTSRDKFSGSRRRSKTELPPFHLNHSQRKTEEKNNIQRPLKKKLSSTLRKNELVVEVKPLMGQFPSETWSLFTADGCTENDITLGDRSEPSSSAISQQQQQKQKKHNVVCHHYTMYWHLAYLAHT